MWDLDDVDAEPIDPTAVHVQLLGLPATLWLAARQHHGALLRELHLLNADRKLPFNIAAADTACRYISRAVDEGIDQAEAAGHARNPLPDGHPSALPWVPEDLDVSFELTDDPCEQAIAQVGGAPAIPWAGTGHEHLRQQPAPSSPHTAGTPPPSPGPSAVSLPPTTRTASWPSAHPSPKMSAGGQRTSSGAASSHSSPPPP